MLRAGARNEAEVFRTGNISADFRTAHHSGDWRHENDRNHLGPRTATLRPEVGRGQVNITAPQDQVRADGNVRSRYWPSYYHLQSRLRDHAAGNDPDRKSTRLNSSHLVISY